MIDNRNKLIEWIHEGMDFNQGINLLEEFSGKPFFRSFFTGKEKTKSRKLSYEICKASGVAGLNNWEDFILRAQKGEISVKPTQSVPKVKEIVRPFDKMKNLPITEDNEEEIARSLPLSSFPSVIRRIVYEYASLFQERSKLHTVMVELPESNAANVTAKRVELFDMITSISDRMTILYEAKKNYDAKRIIPDEKDIFPEDNVETEEEDFALLNEKELKSRKKNLQNSNSRDQSMLDYQSLSHGKEKKPMPSGPKRIKLELRMQVRAKKIEAVDMALLKYVNKV